MKLKAAPFLNKTTEAQHLILFVNGREVGRKRVSTNDWVDYASIVPKTFVNKPILNIKFILHDAVSVYGETHRALGIAVKSIMINRK